MITLMFVYSIFLFINLDGAIEKGWCGIHPLKSSKTDVERMFGNPIVDDNGYHTYITKTARIQVSYSTPPCTDNRYGRGRYNVPQDTVVRYWVRPVEDETILSKLKFDKDKFVRDTSGDDLRFIEYRSVDLGIDLSVEVDVHKRELIRAIDYSPSLKNEERFACPK
jgi:hypothetical protein